MTKHRLAETTGFGLNPGTEKLLSKLMDLEEMLEGIEAQQLSQEQQHILGICKDYLEEAKHLIELPLRSTKFPFFRSRHPHLIWELLHRVDEYLILLIKDDELQSTATDIMTAFDLNIKEEKVREQWLGDKGKLKEILDHINQGKCELKDRYALRDVQKRVNEQVDRTFWQLSTNTLTSVCSGAILFGLIILSWAFYSESGGTFSAKDALASLASGGLGQHFLPLFVLGLMGAYLSNLMTREDFLYLRGGPFFRYFLHNLFSKPVMSAFAAIFIYILARSKLIFSIGSEPAVGQILNINVSKGGEGYAYAVLAIVSGFAAEKILRSMIDSVLKKLEQKAEKMKDAAKT